MRAAGHSTPGYWMKKSSRTDSSAKGKELPTRATPIGRNFFTPDDIHDIDFLRDISFPGEFPYTRGISPSMYRNGEWRIAQSVDSPDLNAASSLIREIANSDEPAAALSFSLHTELGISGLPGTRAVRTASGLPLSSVRDIDRLFSGIRRETLFTGFNVCSSAAQLVSMYMASCEQAKTDIRGIQGYVENNVFSPFSLSMKNPLGFPLATDISFSLITYSLNRLPYFSPFNPGGYHIREIGGTPEQEIAFTVASALYYIREAEKREIDPAQILSRMSFILGVGTDIPVEVAKFRAARRIWSRVLRNSFSGLDDSALRLSIFSRALRFPLVNDEMEINMVRSTMQLVAAVLGGVQSIEVRGGVHPSLRDQRVARTLLMIHRIVGNESGIADTIDPVAGSYYIESRTDEIERSVNSLLGRIEEHGGIDKAIKSGMIQSEVKKSREKLLHEMKEGRRLLVGYNILRDGRRKIDILREPVSPSFRLMDRSGVASEKCLSDIASSEPSSGAAMDALIKAFRHGHSIGEVTSAICLM
ncbi:MAG: hypothetical protein J9259_01415 [Thermoplasmata archaeon YP2-bin.285]|uniref:Methylmalonyl-CoA mutase alpha/beta chain catalytic domain-containing protein n=2 Tax=Candidatus Sysuiplasma superficiale TaxID=2823368 RepID=A0A8J8CDH5_9ARCH|nr:hypothetical protein [Candidatus Sysuiplasma superficiale]